MDNPNEEYCRCELPIKVTYNAKENYKVPRCSMCLARVHPSSRAIDKRVERLNLLINTATRNELLIQDKINEIIDLLKANGAMT